MADPIDPIPSAAAPPPPPPPLAHRCRCEIGNNWFAFQRRRRARLYPARRRTHILSIREARRICALLRHAVDYSRRRLVFVLDRFSNCARNSDVDPRDRRRLRHFALGNLGGCQCRVLVVFVVAVIKAFSGVRWEIPYIGPMARKQTGETTI